MSKTAEMQKTSLDTGLKGKVAEVCSYFLCGRAGAVSE